MTGVAGAWAGVHVAFALWTAMVLASLRGGRPGRSQPDAYELLRQEVLAKIAARNLDTSADPAPVGALVREAVADYQRQARTGLGGAALARPDAVAERLLRSILAYGPLTEPIERDDVEEIYGQVRGDWADVYFVDRNGHLHNVEESVPAEELRQVVNRLLRPTGRQVDEAHPYVEAQVLDGRARLTVTREEISPEGFACFLRKYTLREETFAELERLGSITAPAAELLAAAAQAGVGTLITGRPGCGKTSLTNALLRSLPPTQRVLVCERTHELSARLLNGQFLQTRERRLDAKDDEVDMTMRDLVRICLGLSPSILVIGEIRGEEAFELTRAGNAGCGVVATVHSNSAADGLQALTSTALMAGANVAEGHVRQVFSRTFGLVVHLDREDVQLARDAERPILRQVMEIAAVPPLQGSEHSYSVEMLFSRADIGAPLTWTSAKMPEALRARIDRVLATQGRCVQDLLEGGAPRRRPRRPRPTGEVA
jgi:pilus assembly protein CpaF